VLIHRTSHEFAKPPTNSRQHQLEHGRIGMLILAASLAIGACGATTGHRTSPSVSSPRDPTRARACAH